MKPFILVVLLAVVCGSQLNAHYFSCKDFSVFLEPDSVYVHKIVIRSEYYVITGRQDDKKSAERAVLFWNNLSRKFFLKVMDSSGQITKEKYPVCFELTVVESPKPDSAWKHNELMGIHDMGKWNSRNIFYLVPWITSTIENCDPDDPDRSWGLTCGNYFVTVRDDQKDNEQVAAHEIGHTLGLCHENKTGLMQTFCESGSAIVEFEIRRILDFSYRCRNNKGRVFLDERIPCGEIEHISKRDAAHKGKPIRFLKQITTD